jgi:hypothetical protein
MKKLIRSSARVFKNRLTLLQGIARGEKAVVDGHILTHAQARKRMLRWLKSPVTRRYVGAESEAGRYFTARATPGRAKAILAKAGKRARLRPGDKRE